MDNIFGAYLNVVRDVGTQRGREAKLPMHIVGTSTYVHQHIPDQREWDIYLFFLPSPDSVYHLVSVFLFTDKKKGVKISSYKDKSIHVAMKNVLATTGNVYEDVREKKKVWIQNTIYKCPKISLNNVLHLQDYK